MSEEESITSSIKPIINARETHKDNHLYSLQLNAYQLDCIKGLLDLYNKEKSAKETLGNVVLKLTEENKKLNKYWVSKDKIKEKIEEIRIETGSSFLNGNFNEREFDGLINYLDYIKKELLGE